MLWAFPWPGREDACLGAWLCPSFACVSPCVPGLSRQAAVGQPSGISLDPRWWEQSEPLILGIKEPIAPREVQPPGCESLLLLRVSSAAAPAARAGLVGSRVLVTESKRPSLDLQ